MGYYHGMDREVDATDFTNPQFVLEGVIIMSFPFIQLMKWSRAFMQLLPLPNWFVVEEVRLWVMKCLGVADKLADETDTNKDDQLVAVLRTLVIDPTKWVVFYDLIMYLLGKKNEYPDGLLCNDAQVEVVAEDLGIDLSIFRQLIDWIMEMIEKFLG